VLLPVALVFLILLVNDRQLMGEFVNRRAHNVVAILIVAFVALSGTAYAVDSFLQTVHVI
jgi:Mn2+/Fe2+ NRAMP family transporter